MRILLLAGAFWIVALCSSCNAEPTAVPGPSHSPVPVSQVTEAVPEDGVGLPWKGEPTQTVIPTSDNPQLTVRETVGLILGMIAGSSSCELPCLVGVMPGKTSVAEVETLLEGFGDGHTETESASVLIYDDLGAVTVETWDTAVEPGWSLEKHVNFSYYLDGSSTVQSTTAYLTSFMSRGNGASLERTYSIGHPELLNLAQHFALPETLARDGVPSRVLIAPFPYEGEPWPEPDLLPFSLVLVYEDTGFLVEYILTLHEEGGEYSACTDELWEVSVVSWDPKSEPNLTEMLRHKDGLGISANLIEYFLPLEEATDIDLEAFRELLTDPGKSVCLSTPASIWGR
jgi:hypothetical protein